MSDTQSTSRTREKMLEQALEMIQTRGYNGFSYRDLEEPLGIRTASMHYHFPTKEELVQEVMAEYRRRFQERLAEIYRDIDDAVERLEAYVQLFAQTLRRDRLCACGMLATELITLPAGVRLEVRRFFSENEAWLTDVIVEGQAAGQLSSAMPPESAARTLFAALEGAMIAGRTMEDAERLVETGQHLLRSILSVQSSLSETS